MGTVNLFSGDAAQARECFFRLIAAHLSMKPYLLKIQFFCGIDNHKIQLALIDV